MVHTGFRHGPTAALGHRSRDLVLGDEVRCVPWSLPAAAGGNPGMAGPFLPRGTATRTLPARTRIVRNLTVRNPFVRTEPTPTPADPTSVAMSAGRRGSPRVTVRAAGRPHSCAPPRAELDFAICMSTGGYLAVAAGRITAWTDTRAPGVPLFDVVGDPVMDDEPEPGDVARSSVISAYGPPSGCAVCAAVRSGAVDRLRAECRAALAERRRVTEEMRAVRRRGALRPLPSWRAPD